MKPMLVELFVQFWLSIRLNWSRRCLLNGLCWDDDYTIPQWLEHGWPQAKVPGLNPGGDSQFFFRLFPFARITSNSTEKYH